MTYKVIARRWRPQRFEDLIGQEHIVHTLINSIKEDRISHAYLFSGPRGVGKTSAARILAKSLNCMDGPAPVPCNKCINCNEITGGSSTDVIEIDGASNRGIDEVRELRENIKFTPMKSKYKIYIIDEVHMLTKEAFNALLKTLEEPPGHIVFIFATTEVHRIPETISSRCQKYNFRKITLSLIIEQLKKILEKEEREASGDALFSIAKNSEGSLRDAQGFLDQLMAFSKDDIKISDVEEVLGIVNQQINFKFLEMIIKKKTEDIFKEIKNMTEIGVDIINFFNGFIRFLRAALLVRIGYQDEELIGFPVDEINKIRDMIMPVEADEIIEMLNYTLEYVSEIKNSLFPHINLELAIIKLIDIKDGINLKKIYKKVRELEGGMTKQVVANSEINEKVEENKTENEEKDEKINIDNVWLKILDMIKQERISLTAFLKEAKVKSFDGNVLVLRFPGTFSFHYERVMETKNYEFIKGIVNKVLGRDITLVIEMEELKETENIKAPENNEKGSGDKYLKSALDCFRGEILKET